MEKNKIDDQFRVMAFRNPIVPDAAVSGFIFTNLDEGTKVVDIDLIASGKTKFFILFVPALGIKVDFNSLYLEVEIVDLDENHLRAESEDLPCCTTNESGTENGDPRTSF